MDFSTEYCPDRKRFEDVAWNLVGSLNEVVKRIGHFSRFGDHRGWKAAQSEFTELKAHLSEARYRLQTHRNEHGC